jgi:Fe-S oxidoreductase
VTAFLPTITRRDPAVPAHDDPLAQASLCSTCPKLCRPTCPVSAATGRESVAPWRISGAVARGVTSDWSAEWAAESLVQVASCTGCLACAQPCLPGTNLPEESRAARAAAASAGAVLPAAQRIRARIAATGSPRPAATGSARPPARPTIDPPVGTVLWLGCPARRDGAVRDAALALFAAAGEPVRCDDGEPCCGAVALDLGLADEARALATNAAAHLAGAERVVVASPSCARMMRDEWPRLGLAAPPVVTGPEWLASAAFAYNDAGPLAWHAPCALTRALGVVDEPLAVLHAMSTDVREPLATGLDTRCSGAGMAYGLVDPAGSAAVAAARTQELAVLDAPVVTACPSAARALGGTDLLVLAARLVRR